MGLGASSFMTSLGHTRGPTPLTGHSKWALHQDTLQGRGA